MDAATWGLIIATFVACFVEMVEATTIVMAMGYTRSWRSALAGTFAALGALAVVTLAAGYALANWLPESALQLAIGGLLLIFGLQWLRKAILRSSGRKAIHDEDAIYREEVAAAKAAVRRRPALDLFAFMVSFKGVFLEGMEVVFIVLTFGLNANNIPGAALGAIAAVVIVLGARRRTAPAAVDDQREPAQVRRRPAARVLRHLLGGRGSRHLPGGPREPRLAWSRPDDPGPAGRLAAAQPDLRRGPAQAGRSRPGCHRCMSVEVTK